MAKIRVALPGYNAQTDTNPDHFALRSDEDWVLIKEFSRGSISVSSGGSQTVYHNLGYVPTVLAYAVDAFGYGNWVYGETMYAQYKMEVYTDKVVFKNAGTNATFKYYIFYDPV